MCHFKWFPLVSSDGEWKRCKKGHSMYALPNFFFSLSLSLSSLSKYKVIKAIIQEMDYFFVPNLIWKSYGLRNGKQGWRKKKGKKCSVSGPKSNFLFKCKLKHTVSEKRMAIGKERVVTSFLVLSFFPSSFSSSLLLSVLSPIGCWIKRRMHGNWMSFSSQGNNWGRFCYYFSLKASRKIDRIVPPLLFFRIFTS